MSAITDAVTAVHRGDATREEAILGIGPADLSAVLHSQFEGGGGAQLCSGIGASPGVAVGQVCLSVDAVLDLVDAGGDPILVAAETGPADEVGMRLSVGIVTSRGGLASHAAVVARGWAIPAVCGATELHVDTAGGLISVGDVVVQEGDTISIDGAAGSVTVGGQDVAASEIPAELDELMAWADEIRAGKVGVRANADTGPDAAAARELGADGIGLCRTEHMFLGDRLPLVQRLLHATDAAEREAALDALEAAQRQDFVAILDAMDGLPVTVRLLDAPLHEFMGEASHEQNPMIGLRGIRLAIVTEGLYRTQVRALLHAAEDRRAAGGDPIVEIMIPLVSVAGELAAAHEWIDAEIADAVALGLEPGKISVGTMVETPRAALRCGDLAEQAEFVSFGTNDLTQMTFGFSRDDVETSVIVPYIERGLLSSSPFDTLDADGVGELVAMGIERGRAIRPDLKAGICGEHGGDASSIHFVVAAGWTTSRARHPESSVRGWLLPRVCCWLRRRQWTTRWGSSTMTSCGCETPPTSSRSSASMWRCAR